MMNIVTHPTRAALAISLAEQIADILQDGVKRNGTASIAVSGGSTPALLFAELSNQKIDWAKISITLVDERWVPESNERSNARLVKSALLKNEAAKAVFLPLFDETIAVNEINNNAAKFEDCLPFDIVILGMGNDGHTASFFPGGNNLEKATDPKSDLVLIDMEADGAGEPRVTFTLSALVSAHHLILHIEGDEKKKVLMEADQKGCMDELPIRHILNARKDLKVVWA